MPVYVLHQPLIIGLAVHVVAIPAGLPLKLTLLLAGATVATFAAHHLVVRRSPLLRRLLSGKEVGARRRRPAAAGVPVG